MSQSSPAKSNKSKIPAKRRYQVLAWELQPDGSYGGKPYYSEVVRYDQHLQVIQKFCRWNHLRQMLNMPLLVSRFVPFRSGRSGRSGSGSGVGFGKQKRQS